MSRQFLRRIALPLVIALFWVPLAVAQDRPLLRVMVSDSGRATFDSLLDAMAENAGLTGQLAVSSAASLQVLRTFCRNTTDTSPQIAMATHRMTSSLAAECAKNGADDVAVVEMARDPLILAVRSGSPLTGLTTRQIYLAIAREVPYRDEFVRNTSVRWSDIDPNLPAQDIRFQLPLRDEGSRATLDSLVLQAGCRNEVPIKLIFSAQQRTLRCITTRTDRVRELPRAQAMRALLDAPVGTVGVLSQRELNEANGELVGLALDGTAPTPAAIQTGAYDFSGSLWLYANRDRSAQASEVAAAVERILAQAQSDEIIGANGLVVKLGEVPLPADEQAAQRTALATSDQSYSLQYLMDWVTETASGAWRMFGPRTMQAAWSGTDTSMDFRSLMDIAGYQVTDIQSSIGIIPGASMTFGLAREMSDADHEYLERVLRRDWLVRPGALSAIQRRIIHSIIGVQEVGGFEVTKVVVDFLPLPNVSLVVSPKNGYAAQQQAAAAVHSE